MTPELAYFIKINVAIVLFYAFYRLFFYKDTFFQWRRTVLLCFFALSLLYPLLNIQEWIKEIEPIVTIVDIYATAVFPQEVVITPQETTTDWQELITPIIIFIYWTGVLILVIRLLMQLGSIIRLHFQCTKCNIKRTRVHLLKEATGPFSFFQWIFIHMESHTESEISEIIVHEKAHARQYHSIDVLISECMCIFCWYNPFVWLMKREVRGNLEYMADYKVLETGHDSKAYQYHLLELAHYKATTHLSNNFNVLPLKNRIKMMNKKRTKEVGRTKYLMFLPLAALLMIVSNIETVARTTKEFAKEMMKQAVPQLELATLSELSTMPVTTTTLQNRKVTTPPQKENKQKEPTLIPDQYPIFPGGTSELLKYLAKNTKYPVLAYENKIQGRVVVQFLVTKTGEITDAKIVKGVSPHLDKEAIRVISAMPRWIPGKQNGKVVDVKFVVPVMFKIESKSNNSKPKLEEVKNSHLPEVVVVGYGANKKIAEVEKAAQKVQKMPAFPGGEQSLFRYLSNNIKYPTLSAEKGEEGMAVVEMIIGKDGSLSGIKIAKSASPMLDAEAIRVVSNMPKWQPGQQDGKEVNVQFTLPITFRLQKPNQE